MYDKNNYFWALVSNFNTAKSLIKRQTMVLKLILRSIVYSAHPFFDYKYDFFFEWLQLIIRVSLI